MGWIYLSVQHSSHWILWRDTFTFKVCIQIWQKYRPELSHYVFIKFQILPQKSFSLTREKNGKWDKKNKSSFYKKKQVVLCHSINSRVFHVYNSRLTNATDVETKIWSIPARCNPLIPGEKILSSCSFLKKWSYTFFPIFPLKTYEQYPQLAGISIACLRTQVSGLSSLLI